jgi:2-methylisocitrate lyase-like PEP mutase family enzyme
MTDVDERGRVFHRLHESGCFVIPNPWNVGSARLLEQLGFKALATTSSGFAWSMGRVDGGVTLDDVLAHLRAMSAAVDVPISADFEGGFADDPREVALNVEAAAITGIAGLSIEDSTGDPAEPLYDVSLAVERVHAAQEAIARSGHRLLLTARSEGFIRGRPDRAETIRRLVAYGEAGADCLFAPGLRSTTDIKAIVDGVAPKPVNVLMSSDFATVADLAALGVRRVSVGGSLARTGWTSFLDAAREIAEHGTFQGLSRAITGGEMNKLFS